MLTEQEKGIVKRNCSSITRKRNRDHSYFYNRMFQQHPELKICLTKLTNKRIPSTALAQSVLAAAVNIEHLENILPVVKEIAYKHCALQVPPAGYDIVGENLIEAIKAVLGLEDSHPIIQTWKKHIKKLLMYLFKLKKIFIVKCYGKVSNHLK